MQRVKLLALATLAVFALSAVAAAAASAEETGFLPQATAGAPVKFEVKSGAGKFETLSKSVIECKKDKGTGEITSERLGKFAVEFEECTGPLGVKCADLSRADATGIIAFSGGEFHLRMGLSGQPLGVVAFLLPTGGVHFLCAIALFVVTGCVAGEITPINELNMKLEVLLKQAAGENVINSIDNDAETGMEACALSSKKGAEAAETAGEETHEELEKFTKGGIATTILVMV